MNIFKRNTQVVKLKEISSTNPHLLRNKWLDKIIPAVSTPIALVGGLLAIVITYLIINTVFLGVQEVYHIPDTVKLNNLEKSLNTTKSEILSLETSLNNEQKRLGEMKAEMDRLKYLGYIQQYNNMVNNYNPLVSSFRSDYQLYSDKVDMYNQKAEEYNELAKKAGKRWIIVPIPKSGKIHLQ